MMYITGFNSGRYDINLARKEFLHANGLTDHEIKRKFVIKKNNNYMVISTPFLKYLDVSNYLAAGTSYEIFLRSYKISMRKSYFPYEYMDDFSRLDETELPPYDAFFSTLKNVNTLDEEHQIYMRYLQSHNSNIDEVLEKMEIKSPPLTGQENYRALQDMWTDNMTMKDLLIYYNNLDTKPFTLALNKMLSVYRKKNIDLFKETVSVPGVARILIHRSVSQDVGFSLFTKESSDVHRIFENNIIGGPSIVFCRLLFII